MKKILYLACGKGQQSEDVKNTRVPNESELWDTHSLANQTLLPKVAMQTNGTLPGEEEKDDVGHEYHLIGTSFFSFGALCLRPKPRAH